MAPRVLIADKLSPAAVEIFKNRGVDFDIKTGLTKEELIAIAGDYDANTPFAIGDGASGIEGSLLLAKEFGDTGFGAFGNIGYRWRVDPVPADIFGSVGIYQRIAGFTVSFTYWNTSALNGLDIGGPGFDPGAGADSGFPALKEVNHIVSGGVGYTDAGGRNYLITIGNNVGGRNTGDKFIVGAFISLPFGP